MNKTTLDYIRVLSKTDEKSLSQKTLKACEEVGELAKVVLPYENAYATTHRFVDKKKILEELADTFLCIQSIVCDLNYSDEEFEEMIVHKMKFWADLQAREGRIKHPIPFEVHVTVDMTIDPNNTEFRKQRLSVDGFRNSCKKIGVKPILLDLHMQSGAVVKDMMTSSTVMGDNRTAFLEMKRISEALSQEGFTVIREKIETIPWHPAAPSEKHQIPTMPPSCYFESHLNVLCTQDKLQDLQKITEVNEAKLSSNVFKKFEDGSFTIMVTIRDYKSQYETFKSWLETIKLDLTNSGFQIEKEIVEFSIYDTKVSHDTKWILQQPEEK